MSGLRLTIVAFALVLTGVCTSSITSAQTPINWGDNAVAFRGQNGGQARFACPSGGTANTVWGTDIYTDDSSICTAAVHAGAIGWGGGIVVIQILPGRGDYTASMRNGVATRSYGPWTGSFAVLGGQAAAPVPTVDPAAWSRNAEAFIGQAGPISIYCPPGGTPNTIWGTDYYSTDSSVCTAAVHAGAIGLSAGGQVTIYMQPGLSSYTATTRNGITSASWGQWSSSFSFTPDPPFTGRAIGWNVDGSEVVSNGTSVVVYCPGGGTPDTIWGTDIYTSDSSVCTAAVHAGVINFGGGAVLVTGAPGQASYRASMRNGVASDSWGTWGASFVVAVPR